MLAFSHCYVDILDLGDYLIWIKEWSVNMCVNVPKLASVVNNLHS